MNTNINANDITLRTKFVKLIESEEARQAYTKACKNFCSQAEDAARDIIWRLSYNDPTSADDLRQLGLNPEEIPAEILVPLKNELRSQYTQCHPECWAVDVPEECMEAFTNLKNHTDIIVATKILDFCLYRVSTSEDEMERILFLLKSDMESRHFGGLCELTKSKVYANYLKPFHTHIHDLFMAVYERFKKQATSGNALVNKPFEGLSKRLNQAGVNVSDDELPFTYPTSAENKPEPKNKPEVQLEQPVVVASESPVEVPSQTSFAKFTALTVENILAHKDVFTSFANDNNFGSLQHLKHLGFDLNAVFGHTKTISNILRYAEILEDAQKHLDAAATTLSN